MTAPLFHLEPGALTGAAPGAEVSFGGPEARHAAASMRLAPGESVLLADGSGVRGHGTVLAAAPDAVTVRLDAVDEEPAAVPALVLVQALAKGDRDLMAVQAAVELGVDAVVPWEAERSIVRWKGPKAEKARQKWADTARAGSTKGPPAPRMAGGPFGVLLWGTARSQEAFASVFSVLPAGFSPAFSAPKAPLAPLSAAFGAAGAGLAAS